MRKDRKYQVKSIVLTLLDEITLNDSSDDFNLDDYSSSSFSAFSETEEEDDDSVNNSD